MDHHIPVGKVLVKALKIGISFTVGLFATTVSGPNMGPSQRHVQWAQGPSLQRESRYLTA